MLGIYAKVPFIINTGTFAYLQTQPIPGSILITVLLKPTSRVTERFYNLVCPKLFTLTSFFTFDLGVGCTI